VTAPTVVTRDVSLDETLKVMKRELAIAFPAVKFSVRRSRGTGYGWVHVSWTDGPTDREVSAITRAYEGSRFDGMTDSEYSVDHPSALADGTPVRLRYGTRGINTSRVVSDALRASVYRRIIARHAVFAGRSEALLALDDAELERAVRYEKIGDTYVANFAYQALVDPDAPHVYWLKP
jgi:hypothetical protein